MVFILAVNFVGKFEKITNIIQKTYFWRISNFVIWNSIKNTD